MKTTITALLVAAFLAITPEAESEVTNAPAGKPVVVYLRCAYAVVMIGVGCIFVIGIKRMCDRTFSNHNWMLTNEMDQLMAPALYSGATGPGVMRLQSSFGIGSVWTDEYMVDLQQNENMLCGIVYKDGVQVASNSVPIIEDGPTRLDFRHLRTTNCLPVSSCFFRLIN